MKKRIKKFLVLLMAILFVSESANLLASKAQAEEWGLLREVTK